MIAILLKYCLPGHPNFYFPEKHSTWDIRCWFFGSQKDVSFLGRKDTLGRSLWTKKQKNTAFWGVSIKSQKDGSRWKADEIFKNDFPVSPYGMWKLEPIKATKVNWLIPHNRVDPSPRGALDSALSTLILNIEAMGVPPLPLEDYPTV